jgi:predicted PolB exonuclease-like 3'-5' exonuclease
MFKEGDKYIHFTKYGGINKGVVSEFFNTHCVDTKNCVSYEVPHVRNENGIVLNLREDGLIYKITHEYSEEECENIRKAGKYYQNRKQNKINEYLSDEDVLIFPNL